MSVSYCLDKLPVGVSEVWSHMRDHALPKTPLEAFYLMEARTYCEPSKAHKRRLLKLRPRITRAPRPSDPDRSHRAQFNSVAQLGVSVAEIARNAALLERHYIKGNIPVRAPSTTSVRPLTVHRIPKSDDWPSLEEINANIARLEADFNAERARLKG